MFIGLLYRQSTPFSDLQSLAGSLVKVRGYYDGTKYNTAGMKFHEVSNHQQGITLLSSGDVDYFLITHEVGCQTIEELNLSLTIFTLN